MATILGVLFGIMIGLSLPLWKGVMASVDVLRSLPIIALVPVGVIIFGFTLILEIVIATYAVLWPIAVNTVSGVRQTRSELIDIGRIIRMTRIEKLWKLILPSALPLILVGLRLGLGLSLVLAIVTEIVGTPNGIGYALINAEQALHPAQMFVYILITGVIGYLLNGVFIFSTRLILPAEKAAEKR
jgi:ABC-type nitrate/sulfonate/bicarbonate transport system permease component